MRTQTGERLAELTRRRFVQVTGATATVVVLSSGPARLMASAVAATPSYLQRRAYVDLVDETFVVDDLSLTLVEVADLPRAASDRSLAGRDDAFVLTFTGPAAPQLSQATYDLHHERLGTATLFLVPVDRTTHQQRYEAVIDRTVKLAEAERTAPHPPASTSNADYVAVAAAPAVPVAATGTQTTSPERRTVKRKARARRVVSATLRSRGGVLSTSLRLVDARKTAKVRVSLVRDDVVYARGTQRLRGRSSLRVPMRRYRRLKRGSYDLVITTVSRTGWRATTRMRLKIR